MLDFTSLDIIDNLLTDEELLALIFLVYSQTTNKHCWIRMEMFPTRNFPLNLVNCLFGNESGFYTVIADREKSNNNCCFAFIVYHTICLT